MIDQLQDEVRRELDRVCDRLRTMPITRLAQAAELAFHAAEQIVLIADTALPLPRLADAAAADQLAVVGKEALRNSETAQLRQVLSVLAELRRSLP